MERWEGKVAVVTGASVGIGAAIAQKLVESGLKVVGLARRREKIEALSKKLSKQQGDLFPIKCDITCEEDIMKAFRWISDNLGPISILVNNAGIHKDIDLISARTEDMKAILDTNVLGLCIATREAAKNMMQNKIDGHIVHISSVSSYYVFPGGGVYSASKHAVRALTEALRKEFNTMQCKCKITSICPGAVDTEILKSVGVVQGVKDLPVLKAEDIADAVIYVLSTPPHVQIHDMIIKPVGEVF